jgi:VCBS repeat-containing protein
VTIQPNGEFVYDPRTAPSLVAMRPGDPATTDTFTYVVADSGGLWTKGTVTVSVTGENSPPNAVADQYATMEDVVLVVPAAGVLANDSDPDSEGISAKQELLTSQYGATIQMNADGSFSYDPLSSPTLRALETGQSLSDTFTYTVMDDEGAAALGTVTVVVGGISGPTYQNPANHYDVNGDGSISPIDPLILINYINANGQTEIPPGRPRPPYLDVNGDGMATAADVVMVVNQLNAIASGEGEADVTAESGDNMVAATVGGTLPFVGSLLGAQSDTEAIVRLAAPSANASKYILSGDDDLSAWDSLAPSHGSSVSPAPERSSVFDTWDADGEDLEDMLETISREADNADRQAAIDTLLGGLFD